MQGRWLLIVGGSLMILLGLALTAMGCDKRGDPLPAQVVFEQPSPEGDIVAVVYVERTRQTGQTGGDERAWLGLRYPDSECILRYELTEGQGRYEGGIHGLTWLNGVEVVVHRTVADQSRDLVYNTETHSWREHAGP